MRAFSRSLPILPALLLGVTAVFSIALGAQPWLPIALSLGGIGVLVGVWAKSLAMRAFVVAFEAELERVAAGRPIASPSARSGGPLAQLAGPLGRVVDALAAAQAAATIDRLTRIANRPALLDHAFSEADRASRYGRPLAIAFIDIDNFKAVNDSHGHDVGDIVLRGVAKVFRDNLRAADFVGRYGGEEFMLILPETTAEEATAVAEKLRLLVLRERFTLSSGVEIWVSVSVGIAGGQGHELNVADMIRDADAAMYSAKALGRNQTFVFAEPTDDERIRRAPISAEGHARAMEVGEAARHAAEAVLAAIINPLPHYRGKPSPIIAAIAVRLATELGLPQSEIERIRVAALLHDIGKVAVPAQILDKPGALTATEWQSVVQHPRIGQVIIDQVAAVQDAGKIILHHHERFSGHGYPYGLRGTEIPLGARIVAIADAYDAMIQDRPYQQAISHDGAIAELRAHAGRQFDPELITLFCDLYANEAPTADASLLIGRPVAAILSSRRDQQSPAATA